MMPFDCAARRWFLAVLVLGLSLETHAALVHHQVDARVDDNEVTVVVTASLVEGVAPLTLALPDDAALEGATTTRTLDLGPSRSARARYRLPLRQAFGVQRLGTGSWLPVADGARYTLDLNVTVPASWEAVSQGRMTDSAAGGGAKSVRFAVDRPQRRLDLMAGPWTATTSVRDGLTARVLLRRPDAALAQTYLEATHRYVALYAAAFGPYPHPRFTLVENDAQTGWGMPGFTLLGSRVIRLPFIVHTSYPHEILHNWFGNGVYPTGDGGNWSEGITTYLADHWLRERRGEGVRFRRDALARFAVEARTGRDFALGRFTWRDSRTAQSVGYDKAMMLFHMVRREVGDAVFISGLRDIVRERMFDGVGLGELVSRLGHPHPERFTRQWSTRTSAPALELGDVVVDGDVLRVPVTQSGDGPAWDLTVPIAVLGADGTWRTTRHRATARDTVLEVPRRPGDRGVALDPHHDLMRLPARDELPALIGDALGAANPRFVVAADGAHAASWRDLAGALGGADAALASPQDPPDADHDATVWLGVEPPFAVDALAALADVGQRPGKLATALAWRDGGTPALWLAASGPEGVARLGRALRHYTRQSHVIHDSERGRASSRGQWAVTPLTTRRSLDGSDPATWPLPPAPPPLAVAGLAPTPGAE